MAGRVFVVTGSNKGIGFATVKALCQKLDPSDIVYLTARSVGRGTQAVKELESQGLKPKFHALDVEDQGSIDAFAQYIKTEHGGLDVLINNAGVSDLGADGSFGELAKTTIDINYFGLKAVSKALFPLLRPHSRIVNMASCLGFLGKVPGKSLRERLGSSSLTEQELDHIMNDFVKAAATGSHTKLGWQHSAYGVSKAAVTALTIIQQKDFDADTSKEDIVINCCHPGYVISDMTNNSGVLSIEEGCRAPIYLATLPKNISSPRGQFVWYDTQIVDWVNGPLPAPGY